jgi:hypothetical protein
MFRFRYVVRPWMATRSHWMWHFVRSLFVMVSSNSSANGSKLSLGLLHGLTHQWPASSLTSVPRIGGTNGWGCGGAIYILLRCKASSVLHYASAVSSELKRKPEPGTTA